jgi:DUF1680 family protein
MKRSTTNVLIPVTLLLFFAACSQGPRDYAVKSLPVQDVKVTDAFWQPRLETNRTVSLAALLERAEGSRFADGRILEAVSYVLATHPDEQLQQRGERFLDKLIESLRPRKGIWENRGDGPFFFVGHFLEGAVAFHQATGSQKALDAAKEIADDIDATFGPGKRYDISNHEGIKIGLVKLYRATGDEKYLELAKFIMDARGRTEGGRQLYGEYAQDHQPVVEQTRAIGHAVRATYLYAALTDLAALTGDAQYSQANQRIWEDAVSKRTYLTGGIGSYRDDEDFGDDYDLPNLSCWNEICAAVGNVLWNQRLFQATQDAQYVDVLERILYNGLLVGVSLSGDRYLYQAPLKAYDNFERQPSFGPNCCPPNIVRLLASLGTLIYAGDEERLFVNLFVGSEAKATLAGTPTTVVQQTGYPWNGATRITVNPARPTTFALLVRVPGWARSLPMPGLLYRYTGPAEGEFSLTVNGSPATHEIERGYVRIARDWQQGDVVELTFPMPVRKVHAHEQAAEDRGMVALERGPLVYCAERADNPGGVFNLVVPDDADLKFGERRDLLGGIGVISGQVAGLSREKAGAAVVRQDQELVAIPYYAFGNRGGTDMAVWMAQEESRAEIAPRPTIASTSRASSSSGNGTVAENYPGNEPPTVARRMYPHSQDGSGSIAAIYDQIEPVNSEDGSGRFLRLRPLAGDQAWVQYDFARPAEVSSVSVYWKDDKQYCVLPRAWRLLYRDGTQWKPVEPLGPYAVEKDQYNRVGFAPVRTSGLRLEIQLQPKTYTRGDLGPPDANYLSEDLTWYEGGVIEWRVNE